jgi:Na+-transporting NADH:ubiquinone oxidoreductase subunit C
MKNGYGYTIVFMLLVSIAFGAVLSLTQVGLSPRIARNALIAERRAILEALAEDTTGGDQAILDRFTSLVRPEVFAGLNAYALTGDDGSIDAYAVPFAGAGLWGTIRGYLAVTPDLSTVVGLTFTEQNETPGLGGRIDEPSFKEQFRGLAIDPTQGLAYGPAGGNQLDAITGATSTSRAVLQILNRLLQETLVTKEAP